MNILSTQREAWQHVQKTLGARHHRVLTALKNHPEGLTSHQYARLVGKPLHAVSGDFSRLRQCGAIVPIGRRMNPMGRAAMVWGLVPPSTFDSAPMPMRDPGDSQYRLF